MKLTYRLNSYVVRATVQELSRYAGKRSF